MLSLSPGGRRYGFIPSPVDVRDLKTPFRLAAPGPPIPPAVDLSSFCGPIKDQGQEGSCTAHAGTENLEYLFRRFKRQSPVFSPQFLYYKEREMDGSLPADSGSYGRTAVKCINQFGCCLTSSDPYDTSKMNEVPTMAQLDEAVLYKAGAYHALSGVDEIKHCIASGYTFLLGFSVYENFETGIGSDGIMPPPTGNLLGGHEVHGLGYDDNKQSPTTLQKGYFKIQNSWGDAWGDKGFFYMAYEDLVSVMSEAWIQHFGKPWGA